MRKPKDTLKIGRVNPKGQVVIRRTQMRGTDKNAYVIQLACSHCGCTYGANSGDVWQRKCPCRTCQDGAKGEPLCHP
jgi:hypothetical protein